MTIAGVVQKPFDVVMKSSALEAYANGLHGEWLVIVDADEFLELPYSSLGKTIEALGRMGLDELPALLLQRAAADGSLPALSGRVPLDALFPCYDYRLADRMNVTYPIWKNKYPLVRLGPQFRLSRGHHLPSAGRPSAHIPVRGVLHHFKWRDRLLRSMSRVRGEASNQREQDAYRCGSRSMIFRLPTDRAQIVQPAGAVCGRSSHAAEPLRTVAAFRPATSGQERARSDRSRDGERFADAPIRTRRRHAG